MNTTNWKHFFKYEEQGIVCCPQQTYEPLISPDEKTFCANYDPNNTYQSKIGLHRNYSPEVVNYFFEQEIFFLEYFKNESFIPNNIDIDYKNQKIYFEWNNKCCNHLIYEKNNFDMSDWLKKLKKIIKRQVELNVYKLSLYPHCHFIQNNKLKTFDFYACTKTDNPYIDKKYIDSIISTKSLHRIKEPGIIVNSSTINLEEMFKNGLRSHVKWGEYFLETIYEDLFNGKDNI